MNKKTLTALFVGTGMIFWVAGCNPPATDNDGSKTKAPANAQKEVHEGAGHAHDETELGTVKIGDMDVKLAQGHGKLVAGKEGHLVVKLPYNDNGSTVVRAWIGTKDRTLSFVGKGDYAASHDDYDVHAMAPATLSADTHWWIEIVKPDGTKAVGSAKPLMD